MRHGDFILFERNEGGIKMTTLKASEIFDVEPETPPKLEEKANTYVKAWYLRTLPIVDLDNEGVEIPPPTQKEWESTVKRDLHRFMREAREEGYEAGYKTAVKDFSSRTCPYCHKSSKLYTREEWDKM